MFSHVTPTTSRWCSDDIHVECWFLDLIAVPERGRRMLSSAYLISAGRCSFDFPNIHGPDHKEMPSTKRLFLPRQSTLSVDDGHRRTRRQCCCLGVRARALVLDGIGTALLRRARRSILLRDPPGFGRASFDCSSGKAWRKHAARFETARLSPIALNAMSWTSRYLYVSAVPLPRALLLTARPAELTPCAPSRRLLRTMICVAHSAASTRPA